jgi:flagellar biosynthetic protein FliR
MHTELHLDMGMLYAFLLVLARVSGAFIYVPLPGLKNGPEVARVVLSVSLTFALFSSWPHIDPTVVNIGVLIGWIVAEAGLGIAVGLAVGFLTEGFQLGAQIVSLQAGYSFATTIDPTSGADSTVLLTIGQLTAGLLFFATGLDRQVLLAFAQSLTAHPPGHFAITRSMAEALIEVGGTIFVTGLRLVLPILGLLMMVEISLALLSRLNSQLHVMQLSMPIKMLTSLVLLGWLVSIFPKVFTQSTGPILHVIRTLLN